MLSQRWRPVFYSALAVVAIWLAAWAGHTIARNSVVTADKVRAYVESLDLTKLSGSARAKALQRLAGMLNALSPEERRRARMDRLYSRWFAEMTEEEKGVFIEATLPTGFKQMLTAFEEMPEERRHRAVEDAVRRLKQAQTRMQGGSGQADQGGTNGPPPLSDELQAKMRTIGLKAFYSQSSAQTKAEMAPVLEELQKVMESGRPFRGR